MAYRRPFTALPAAMFHRTAVTKTTTMTALAYRQLVEAAIAKGKLPELRTWQRDRKIILKG